MTEDPNRKPGDEQRENYTLLNNQFSLRLPREWQDRSLYRFHWPDENESKHNITVSIEHNVDLPNLKQYADLNVMALRNAVTGFEELKRGEILLDNNMPAYEVVYKWIPLSGEKYYQRNVYLMINTTGYIISASFTKKLWKMRAGEVDKIIKGFNTSLISENIVMNTAQTKTHCPVERNYPVQDNQFFMTIPSEWIAQHSYAIEGPEDDGIKHTIAVKIEDKPEKGELKDIAGQKIAELAAALNGFKQLSFAPVELDCALPAYEVIYTWIPKDQRDVYQRMMFVEATHCVYTLIATFSERTFNKLGRQVGSIYKSFNIVHP